MLVNRMHFKGEDDTHQSYYSEGGERERQKKKKEKKKKKNKDKDKDREKKHKHKHKVTLIEYNKLCIILHEEMVQHRTRNGVTKGNPSLMQKNSHDMRW